MTSTTTYESDDTALPEEKLMYNSYDEMNSTNIIDHLENLKSYTIKNGLWKRLILIWDNASFPFKQDGHGLYQCTERGLADHNLSTKENTVS